MDIEKAAASPPETFQSPSRPFVIPEDQMTPEQRAFVERIQSGPRGKVPINQRVWMHNMRFADVAERFGAYVSAEAPMTPRQKEICILVTASFWQSAFEWHWHQQLALKKGITQQQVDAIERGADPKFEDQREQITYELCHALSVKKDVSDALYERAAAVLGRSAVLDLIGLMGLYGMIAQTIKFFKLQVPPVPA